MLASCWPQVARQTPKPVPASSTTARHPPLVRLVAHQIASRPAGLRRLCRLRRLPRRHRGVAEDEPDGSHLGAASASTVLSQHLGDIYHYGPYTYSPQKTGDNVTTAVTDGPQTRTAPLEWAFGSGDVGQSYLWQQDGAFRESRFNYFATLHGFAATPGRLHGAPTSIDIDLGRPLEDFEARTCFACHTTTMSPSTPIDVRSIVPGVSCESCHGPGAAHIAAVEANAANPAKNWERRIVNSGKMSPAQSVDFCGACHSTPWDVRLMGAVGLATVRFPAYRLEKSRCWGGSGDARVTCIACHDPHQPIARETASYDHACLACHQQKGAPQQVANHPGAACPIAASKCTSCHMPRYELPEMHYKFTDHMIRIARTNAPFPD